MYVWVMSMYSYLYRRLLMKVVDNGSIIIYLLLVGVCLKRKKKSFHEMILRPTCWKTQVGVSTFRDKKGVSQHLSLLQTHKKMKCTRRYKHEYEYEY